MSPPAWPPEYTDTCPPDHRAGIGARNGDWHAYCSCGWSLTECASRGHAEGEHARHVARAYRSRDLEPPPGFERFAGEP